MSYEIGIRICLALCHFVPNCIKNCVPMCLVVQCDHFDEIFTISPNLMGTDLKMEVKKIEIP